MLLRVYSLWVAGCATGQAKWQALCKELSSACLRKHRSLGGEGVHPTLHACSVESKGSYCRCILMLSWQSTESWPLNVNLYPSCSMHLQWYYSKFQRRVKRLFLFMYASSHQYRTAIIMPLSLFIIYLKYLYLAFLFRRGPKAAYSI